MKNFIFLFIPALILSSACTKDDDKPSYQAPRDNYINLMSPSEGQENMYVRFTNECAENGAFTYPGDTLILSVIETDTTTLFKESFTAGSEHFADMEDAFYAVHGTDDYILIPHRLHSTLFFFYGNDTIHLSHAPDLELTQNNCNLIYPNGEIFTGDEIASLATFNMGDITLTDKTAVSCVPPFLDLDAYLIYDESGLAVSCSNELLLGTVNGWVWIR